MFKPFFLALAVGFGIVWLYRGYKKQQSADAIKLNPGDKAALDAMFGPGNGFSNPPDSITGDYIDRTSQPGTVGASQATS